MFSFKERFWKIAAVLLLLALVYVGSGLRAGLGPTATSYVLRTADGAQVLQYKPNLLVTVSDDGKTLWFWHLGGPDPAIPKLEGVKRYEAR